MTNAWEEFYNAKLGKNNRIVAYFDNGYAYGEEVYIDGDIFKSRTINGVNTIVGVFEDRANQMI